MSSIINLIHIFLLVPLFFYVYYKGTSKDTSKNATGTRDQEQGLQPWLCYLLMGLAVISFMYHSYKLYLTVQGEGEKWKDWIYALHILVILPLLFYIGYNCNNTLRKYFELLLVVAFAALGYHSFNLVKYGF